VTGCSKPRTTKKWFFDVNTGRCDRFEYRGCGGNDNHFRSKEECELQCGNVRTFTMRRTKTEEPEELDRQLFVRLGDGDTDFIDFVDVESSKRNEKGPRDFFDSNNYERYERYRRETQQGAAPDSTLEDDIASTNQSCKTISCGEGLRCELNDAKQPRCVPHEFIRCIDICGDPCQNATCSRRPDAICHADTCVVCRAVFLDPHTKDEVDCNGACDTVKCGECERCEILNGQPGCYRDMSVPKCAELDFCTTRKCKKCETCMSIPAADCVIPPCPHFYCLPVEGACKP
jgi:hypothetical protein